MAARDGDVGAFERIYRRHLPRVHSNARWLLGTDDVDDALQEAFIRVWTKLSSFNGDSSLGTWLHRVTTNVILRHRERRGRRGQREVSMEGVTDPSRSPRSDLRLDLEAAVAALPDRARVVFVLHEMEGHDHDEIARMMDTSIATSRSQLHRARRLIRERMTGEAT